MKDVAVKMFTHPVRKIAEISCRREAAFLRELLKHRATSGIIGFVESLPDNVRCRPAIVLEWAPGGDLWKYIQKQDAVDAEEMIGYAEQVTV